MTRVVSFGELLLRLSPEGPERFLESPRLATYWGGAEANVAVSLAHLGFASSYVSRLPENALGDAGVSALASEGVDVTHVARGGERLGLYFLERGQDVASTRVVYDRQGSAFAALDPAAFDWDRILANTAWLHVSGITPALGAGPASAACAALRAARERGIRTSFDLNYRAALWQGRDPRPVIEPLARLADLIIGNAGAVTAMLGVGAHDARPPAPKAMRETATEVRDRFGARLVAITRREIRPPAEHAWSAGLLDEFGSWHMSRDWHIRVTDRVGSGDACAAGLICALRSGRAPSEALTFAVAAGALKLGVPGDFNRATVEDVDRFAQRAG